MKARIAFDTLAYANRLKAAGVDSKAAEAQAEANADMIASLLDDTLATKQDIAQLATATKQDIAQLAATTKQDIAQLAATTKQDIMQVESRLELKISDLETRLLLRLGSITVASVTVGTALLSILHWVH